MATACENCHTQLSDLNTHYEMGVDVQFLSSLVADALVRQPGAIFKPIESLSLGLKGDVPGFGFKDFATQAKNAEVIKKSERYIVM